MDIKSPEEDLEGKTLHSRRLDNVLSNLLSHKMVYNTLLSSIKGSGRQDTKGLSRTMHYFVWVSDKNLVTVGYQNDTL